MIFWDLFSMSNAMPLPPKKRQEGCKHLNTIVRGADHIGQGFCPDCDDEVKLSEVFNNFLTELRKELKK